MTVKERRGVLLDQGGAVGVDMLDNGIAISITTQDNIGRIVGLNLPEARVFLDQLGRMIELVELNNRNEERRT